ncbi:murein DD-endopeptidase MepS/Murein LD-carboxypeptidase [Sporomusaceae bacterium FL31]|nr:murein DD-endopeptidase MepS/Murein LD-carboxypeptidase [Sporomusaceae bacterium FL31]GCE33682.1 murein DD-endopeptidase MepS/Murein LD-carboxypeptidase [Sporomusaceae bacterium]
MIKMDDLIGVPFIDRGRDAHIGLDCWGLVMEVFSRYGIELPDYRIACLDFGKIDKTINEQRKIWIRQEDSDPPIPSLVVIKFNHPILCNHTGIYIGGRQFIHTRQPIGVNIDRIDSPAWRRKIDGFYLPNLTQ